MYCHFVQSQTSLCSCLIVTLSASIFDSFMYSPFVLIHRSLYSCLIVTLSEMIFDFFMYSLVVLWYVIQVGLVSACAKFQLPGLSRSGLKVWVWWGLDQVTDLNPSCIELGLGLGFDNV